jgi:hypothetical protein
VWVGATRVSSMYDLRVFGHLLPSEMDSPLAEGLAGELGRREC